jgi:F-type H+-transporting ATPase subunit b|tara:strand:+ start:124 stop:702 length:579 start_codon:yes stop_codon:yes gene_type:complete
MNKFCAALSIAYAFNLNWAFGAEGGMPQLNPEFWASQVFWLILIFSSLYVIIWKLFLPKITNSIENRKLKIVNDLNETQKLKDNAEKKLQEYNKIIENSKKDAKKIIEDGKKKLNREIESKKQKFNEEIEKELTNVEKEIKNLKKSSMLVINKIAEDISSEIIKQVVGTEINKSKLSAVVQDISKKKIENYL